MAKLIKVTQADQVPPGKAAAFDVEGLRIAVFNVAGQFPAISGSRSRMIRTASTYSKMVLATWNRRLIR